MPQPPAPQLGWIEVTPPAPPPPEGLRSGVVPILAHIVFGGILLIIGAFLVAGFFFGLDLLASSPEERAQSPRPLDKEEAQFAIWANAIVILVLFGILPFGWVLATRNRPIEGTMRYLGFTRPLGHASFVGVGLGGCMLGAVIVLLWILTVLDVPMRAAEGADPYGFSLHLTWTVAVFVALFAGFGEEIFFRGILVRWVRWWGQAPLFMLAHFASGEPLQYAITLAVGIVFGWLRHRGWSLWSLMLAHAVYDFSLLAGALILGV